VIPAAPLDDVQLAPQDDALRDVPTLLDWRRRVADLYREVRADPDPRHAWDHWRAGRDELISSHPQSPLGPAGRERFDGVSYFDYDPRYRVTAALTTTDPAELDIPEGRFTRFARAELELDGRGLSLDCFWLQGYGGGLFLPFGDTTNGTSTYGGGRYLLDTAKGADLGSDDGRLVLDFNFAYNPSCAYDPRWVCPLAPPGNRLPAAVEAGERVS
jgi:uncharacterized protein (DUF1684 family)